MKKLASEWQLAKGSILNILRDSGTTIRRQKRLTNDEIDHAVTSYRNGESLDRIGKRLGLAHTTIRTALQRRGISTRSGGVRTQQ
ncbi:helix-turn-helix domain-containing protein [Nocardia sp. NPDC052316]|uniref:helix-turn-helix domain-containing protein n=1 Tax=Nocardia sp. NPDC052316 TaxID=3364329 RepID=UPI0037C5899F